MFYIPDYQLEAILKEDMPYNDCTTEALGIGERRGKIECLPKAAGIVSGLDLAKRLFKKVGLEVLLCEKDGAWHEAQHKVLVAEGEAQKIHAVYKTAQNIMEYSSGISGRVHAMLAAARPINPYIQVAVTRKHFPGTKSLSLNAALLGGANIHRAGLAESILIFDQHRVFCEDFGTALKEARLKEPEKKIMVEAGSAEEALSFVNLGIDVLQCERFSPDELSVLIKEAKSINPKLKVLAAGGINASNAADYAKTGVDVLVTSWAYFGKPFDIKMKISAI